MKTRKIGSLDVSVVGLGTNNFGRAMDLDQTGRVLQEALDIGINFIDTADVYGGTLSEQFIGEQLKGRRDEAIIATKFGMQAGDVPAGASPEYIRSAIEASLRRLETDRIDLYILHRPDPDTPIADTLQTLGQLVEEGKVVEVGCSNFSVDQLREAELASAAVGTRFVNLQNLYNLLDRKDESDVLPECVRSDIAYVPYSPLANGLLTGKYRRSQPPPEGSRLSNVPEELRNRVFSHEKFTVLERLEEFCRERGREMIELAVSWLLAQPALASVIAGATSREQVRANARAAGWDLTQEELDIVNELAPASSRSA
jgi:aryl-alcohol dehydrogenase-like predicted oxidoreductase